MPVLTHKAAWLRAAGAASLFLAIILHASCNDNTAPPHPVAIRIAPTTPLTLLAGDSYQLKATPLDANGAELKGIDLSWSSGDSSVVMVDQAGLVTGITPGSALIVVSADTVWREIPVRVLAQVTNIAITPPAPSLLVGRTLQLVATAEDAWGGPIDDRPVLWVSEDPAVATVSESGVVSGIQPGSTQISATISKKTATVTVLAMEPIGTLEVVPDETTLRPTETFQFTVTSRNSSGRIIDGRPVQWSVSPSGIATVSAAGLVTAKREGTASITAEAEGQRGTAQLKVEAAVHAVVLTPERARLSPGGTLQLTAIVKDKSGKTLEGREVVWASDHPEIATVSASGMMKAIRPGTSTVTARSEGKEGHSVVTVADPVARVVVTPSTRRLVLGEVFRFSASPRDSDGHTLDREVKWSSERASIATVRSNGTVTAVAEGTTSIEATVDGVDGEAAVEVWQPDDQPVVFVGAGDVATCTGTGDEQTARLLDQIPGVVFLTGDNAYPDGSAADFATCYEPTWGRHKSRTRPVPGNREYLTPNAQGYFDYFGSAAGNPATGYYSYDLGGWHVLALNTQFTGKPGSPQARWVETDLAANPKKCTLAVWHVPLFGPDSMSTRMQHVFDLLYRAGAEFVINGHEHNYQRFAPQTAAGAADPVRGVREFIVGTGGKGVGVGDQPLPNREVAYGGGLGVLKFELYRESYTWKFISVAGKTFSDSGSAACH